MIYVIVSKLNNHNRNMKTIMCISPSMVQVVITLQDLNTPKYWAPKQNMQ